MQEDSDEHDLVGIVDSRGSTWSAIVVRPHAVNYIVLVVKPILAVELAASIIHVYARARVFVQFVGPRPIIVLSGSHACTSSE